MRDGEKKGARLYNVLFPLWLLMLAPQVWLILLPANFVVDTAVLLIAAAILKAEHLGKLADEGGRACVQHRADADRPHVGQRIGDAGHIAQLPRFFPDRLCDTRANALLAVQRPVHRAAGNAAGVGDLLERDSHVRSPFPNHF